MHIGSAADSLLILEEVEEGKALARRQGLGIDRDPCLEENAMEQGHDCTPRIMMLHEGMNEASRSQNLLDAAAHKLRWKCRMLDIAKRLQKGKMGR